MRSPTVSTFHNMKIVTSPEETENDRITDSVLDDIKSIIQFRHAHTNIGGHYSETTGRFTCQYAGIYIFSLNIYKAYSSTGASCRIRHNGNALALVYISETTGYYESSASMIVQLSIGDIVDIGQCSDISTIDSWTSLYGFLLYAD